MSGNDSEKRLSGKSLVFGGIVLVLAIAGFVMLRIVQTSGPGPDPDQIPSRTADAEPAMSFPPYLIFTPDTTLPRTILDSLVTFAPGVSAKPMTPSEWLVDYGWVYLFEMPPTIRTFAEMDSLAGLGVINDDTEIGIAVLRTKVPATNEKSARVRAISARPAGVPPELQQALESMVRPAPPDTAFTSPPPR